MIAELGHFLLILAACASFVGFILPMLGLGQNSSALQRIAFPASYVQFICIGAAFLILIFSFTVSDFSVVTVADNSHSLKPVFYKIAAAWGNHEGSLLLWLSVLTGFGAVLAFMQRRTENILITTTLAVQSFITFGFAVFTLLTSNPFMRIFPVPDEGLGFNPVLQDPALMFHPPMLYLGYVGFALTFSFAAAALITRRADRAWATAVRPWAMAAWIFLTIGISLGCWWAYYELGWGGWWFWDPVENASLMPWLAGTALIHSLAVSSKRGALISWSILLALICFGLSVLGTFMVRSGILTSVHAFALDPERGSYILMFCMLLVGSAFVLFAFRAPAFKSDVLFHWSSRESALILNNIFFILILLLVLVGTFWPLMVDTLSNEKITIAAPFYLKTVIPLFIPLILLIAIAPLLQWSRADIRSSTEKLSLAALAAVSATGIAYSVFAAREFLALGGIALAVWTIFGSAASIRRPLMLSQIGMATAHMGLGVMILGIVGTQVLTTQYDLALGKNETAQIASYTVKLQDVLAGQDKNYFYDEAQITITYKDKPWGFRAYYHPLVIFLWLGMGMIALGGIAAVIGGIRKNG